MGWFFGPPRSKFGEWIEENDLTHVEISKRSGVPRSTVSSLANDTTKKPTRLTIRKLMKVIKEVDPNVGYEDFWS